jgi:hypothetical protein
MTLGWIVKGSGFWVGLLALAAGVLLGLTRPIEQGWLPIAIGGLGFVGTLLGRISLGRHLFERRQTKDPAASYPSPR